MSVISTALKHLIAAGVTGDALVTAVADLEASLCPEAAVKRRSTGAERQARYRERQASLTVTGNAESVTSNAMVSPKEKFPHTPSKEITPSTSKLKRATRLPEDFEPDGSCHALAEELLLSPRDGQEALANFQDYWKGVSGSKGVKLDWQATFRNHLRHIAKTRRPHVRNSPAQHPATTAANKLRADLGLETTGGDP